MSEANDIPEWALHEAARRSNYGLAASTGYWRWFCNVNNSYKELAIMIARHEQPLRPNLRSIEQ